MVSMSPVRATMKADGGGSLTLAGRGGGNGSDQHQLALRPVALSEQAQVDFGLVSAVVFYIFCPHELLWQSHQYAAFHSSGRFRYRICNSFFVLHAGCKSGLIRKRGGSLAIQKLLP